MDEPPVDIYGNPLPEHMRCMPEKKQKSYIPDLDLLNPEVFDKTVNEVPSEETSLLTAARNTLILMSGFAHNAEINEKELTEKAQTTSDVLVYSSNYGKVIYDHYIYPEKPPKTNRGRKRREPKNQKKRQVIGTGTDMNTQVCIWMRSRTAPLHFGYIVDNNALVYKTKFFRTGDLQIPGPNQYSLGDAIACGNILIKTLNSILYPDGQNEIKLMYMIPSLKNYTLSIKLPTPQHIVSLSGLKNCLIAIQCAENKDLLSDEVKRSIYHRTILGENPSAAPKHPKLLDIDFNSMKSRIMVTFHTPLAWKEDKILMLRIFVGGSITVIGGLLVEDIQNVCKFMHWVISTNYNSIIVKANTFPMEQNVFSEDLTGLFERPKLTREDMIKKYPSLAPWMIDNLCQIRKIN